MVKIGIIGGSGLDNPNILDNITEKEINTPYGNPSSTLKCGTINGVSIALIARHGRDHTITPTGVNYRANIHALKSEGCTHILATTAVGSLREQIGRGDLVILDQFIDFTKHRHISFHEEFEAGNAAHTPMAEPFSKELRTVFINNCQKNNLKYHKMGTVITIEGPRFSTKAESHMFRNFGADVINMSIAPEAILANEAGIPYAAVAMSTDYDCWKEDEESVSWDEILKVFKGNAEKVTTLLVDSINDIYDGKLALNMDSKNGKLLKTEFVFESLIRTVHDFPKPGIDFKDITTLIKNPKALQSSIKEMARPFQNKNIDIVVGAESRGFIFGTGVALELGCGFIPARKAGKLPGNVKRKEYSLEYGTDALEIHEDAISPGMNVLVVDDLIATGGTIKATAELVEEMGGKIAGLSFLIDLKNLHGEIGYPIHSLVEYEVDE